MGHACTIRLILLAGLESTCGCGNVCMASLLFTVGTMPFRMVQGAKTSSGVAGAWRVYAWRFPHEGAARVYHMHAP